MNQFSHTTELIHNDFLNYFNIITLAKYDNKFPDDALLNRNM